MYKKKEVKFNIKKRFTHFVFISMGFELLSKMRQLLFFDFLP
jgi:hypothetical protein